MKKILSIICAIMLFSAQAAFAQSSSAASGSAGSAGASAGAAAGGWYQFSKNIMDVRAQGVLGTLMNSTIMSFPSAVLTPVHVRLKVKRSKNVKRLATQEA